MDYLQIARDLIATESITGNEEPVAAYLEGVLRDLGLEVRSQEVAPGRRNLLAGPERPAVLFSTHMDTVPPYIPLREDEEYLYGRGACDTKGISACLLEAGRRLLEAGRNDFGYLFLVGEELDHVGAEVANRTVRARELIVGEPTENRIAVGHKGGLAVRVRVRGHACHSAYPERGDSAVHRLLAGLSRVLAADFGADDILGPATVNIGEVRGGVAHNVFAPDAEARVLVRVVGTLEDAERRLAACFADPSTGEPDPKVTLETTMRMPVAHLGRLEGFPETVVSYGTDLPFLQDVGRHFLFGPGSILDAHTDGEKIAKKEMAVAVDRYVEMAERLLAG
jgi:acetylornithine deacetylase